MTTRTVPSSPLEGDQAAENGKKTIRRRIGVLMVGFVMLILTEGIIQAQDLLPIVDPLAKRQRTVQILAAPSGEDEPLETPETILPAPEPEATEEEPSVIERKVAEALKTISLEEKIEKQIIQAELEQFGYDVFEKVPTTFAPIPDLPVPYDYVIGPGDTVVVQLYGKLNVEYRLVVTRDGQLLVPELGPLQVSGLTFREMKETLKSRFETQLIGARAAITMGELRSIHVFVFGDVVKPGAYTVSGLSTLMNALLASGGVKGTGSLRRIQLKRRGALVTTLDLYDILLRGDTSGDVRLFHNDVIFVPPIGVTVGIGGEVQRPAIYELESEGTVGDVVRFAGGMLPTASLESSHIERIYDGEYRTLIDLGQGDKKRGSRRSSFRLKTRVQAGDLIRIFPVGASMDDVVLLGGHVRRPGGYQWKPAMRVSNLIAGPLDLLPSADLSFSLIQREIRAERRIEVRYVNLGEALNYPGSEADLKLEPRDEVTVFNLGLERADAVQGVVQKLRVQVSAWQNPDVIEIRGNVRYQGAMPLESGTRLLNVLTMAGGLLPGTDLEYSLMTREVLPSRRIDMLPIRIGDALLSPASDANPVITPGDRIYVFNRDMDRAAMISDDLERLEAQTPYGQSTPIASVDGWIRHPGRYPLTASMNVRDLITAGGGLKESGYGLGAELTRYQLREGEYRIAEHKPVDLARILRGDPGTDVPVQSFDRLIIHKKPAWETERIVELAGEVVFPGKYPIKHNETLSGVIWRAGGFTREAFILGAVFTRDSVRSRQQESLDRIQGQLDDLLVQIHLSPSANNAEKMPAGEQKHLIERVIQKLKRAEASGRMVIDLDGALMGKPEADIILENGDRLFVPKVTNEVTVVGEVYHPSSHLFKETRELEDYIDLSGGTTVLARSDHAYVVKANGEVMSMKSDSWFNGPIDVTPGSVVYVPINVDRINRREMAQSWTQILYNIAVSAASLSVVGVF